MTIEEKNAARLLLAHSNEAVRHRQAGLLRNTGWEVIEARDGAEVLRLIAECHTSLDVVILAADLPDMSGSELCQKLKAADAGILVAQSVPREAVPQFEANADAYLMEPVSEALLIAQIKPLLRIRAAERRMYRDAANLALLAELSEAFSLAINETEIAQLATERIKRRFKASRINFSDVNEAGDEVTVFFSLHGAGLKDDRITHRLSEYLNHELIGELNSGRTVAINDIASDPRTRSHVSSFAQWDAGSLMLSPYVSDGRWRFMIALHRAGASDWQPDDIALLHEIAMRVHLRLERARAEAKLRESEERYRSLFASIDEGFCIVDIILDNMGKPADYRFLEVNAVFEEQTGLRNSIGKTALELVPNLERWWIETYGRVALTGESARFEHGSASMGRVFDVYASRVGGEASLKVAIVFKDVTERVLAEKALRRSEDRLRRLLDSIYVFVGVLTPDGVMVECNSAPLRAAGLTREDVIGVHFADCYWWAYSEQSSARIRADIGRAAKGELVRYDAAVQVKTLGGQPQFIGIDFALTPMFDEHGEVTHLIPVGVDISNRRQAERALRDSERQYRSTFDNAAVGIAHFSTDGSFLRVNDLLCELLGYTREELLTKNWTEISHPEEIHHNLELREAALRGETSSYWLEKRYYRNDGSTIWVDVTASLLRDDEGEPLYFIAFIEDIGERKRAEEALRQSEERFRTVTAVVPSFVWAAAPDGAITYANEQWFAYCGLTFDENATSWPELLLHPEDRERCLTAWQKSIETGQDYEIEVRNRRHDGVYRWFLTRARALKDSRGTIAAWYGTTTDIHDRKDAEEKLRYQLQLVSSITDTAAVSIFVNDKDGNVIFVNPEAERVFGYSFDELEGKSLHEILHYKHPDGRPFPIAECPLGFVYEDGRPVRDYEAVFWRKDGSPVNVVCSNMPIREDNKTLGDVITVQDITERKRHEEHQKMLMNELNHRVKNTLATVQSMAMQTLRNSPDLAEARERFEARLIALSKAHDVLTREKWEGAPLTDLVERAIAPYCGEARSRFVIKGPAIRVSPRYALALAMALHELCTNAVKYGALSNDKGKVTIAWSVAGRKGKPKLKMRWSEKGGPKVAPPSRRGFGSRMIERGLANDLNGEVKIGFAKTGVTCSITAPLDNSWERGPLNLADRRLHN